MQQNMQYKVYVTTKWFSTIHDFKKILPLFNGHKSQI